MNTFEIKRPAFIVAALVSLAAFVPQDEQVPLERERRENSANLMVYPFAEDLLSRGADLARAGKWHEAIDLYAGAAEKFPNHVIPLGNDRYEGVREYCTRELSLLPPPARDMLRLKFDPIVKEMVERARRERDPLLLQQVVAIYPYSTHAPDALALLASLAIESGDIAAANRYLNDLSTAERRGGAEVGAIARETALRLQILSLLGENDRLAEAVGKIGGTLAQSSVVVGGKRIRLSEIADALKDVSQAGLPRGGYGKSDSSWRMFGGNGTGSKIAVASTEIARKVWDFPLQRHILNAISIDILGGLSPMNPREIEMRRPYFPAVSDGTLFVQDDYSLYALNLFSAQTSLLWKATSLTPGQRLVGDVRTACAATFHRDTVYANLLTSAGDAESRLGGILVKVNFPRRALYAVDAFTGKTIWKVGGGVENDGKFEEAISFPTAPTPEGKFLYCGVIFQRRATDPFEHYVVCLDAETGAIKWKTFIASALTEINLFGNSMREAIGSPVAIDGESVFCCTNLGAVAALDKTSGAFKWAYRYDQLPVRPTRTTYVIRNPMEWSNNHPIATRGLLIFSPTDSKNLYALDAASGKRKWFVRRESSQRTIYGVYENLLVVGGETLSIYDIETGKIVGNFTPSRGIGTGRGTVTVGAIYFPTTEGVFRLEPKTLREIDFHPWEVMDGGNITIAEGAMILTGSDRVSVFYDVEQIGKEIEAELRKSPDDPRANYRAAATSLRAGKEETSIALFKKAVALTENRAGAENQRLNLAAKKQLWNLSMKRGTALFEAGDALSAAKDFEYALVVATDRQSTVETSMKLGEIFAARANYAGAIDLYQRLIKNYGDDAYRGEKLRRVAAGKIGEIVAARGSEWYKTHAKDAAENFAKATAQKSVESFLEIYSLYPNSDRAPAALYEAALLLERKGLGDRSVDLLRTLIREYPSSEPVLRAAVALILSLEKQNSFPSARSALKMLERRFADRRVDVEGKEMTVKAFVDGRLAREEYRAGIGGDSLPILRPPLKRLYARRDDGAANSVPLEVKGKLSDRHRSILLLRTGASVKAFDGKGESMWTLALDAPPSYALAYGHSIVLCNSQEIQRVALDDGKVEWRHRTPQPAQAFGTSGNVLCYTLLGRDMSRICAIDMENGQEMWQQDFEGALYSQLYAFDEHVLFYTLAPSMIYDFDLSSGRKIAGNPLPSQEGVGNVLYAVEERMCLNMGGQSVDMYEVATGKLLWSASLKNFIVRFMAANEEYAAFVGNTRTPGGAEQDPHILLIDMKSGKLAGNLGESYLAMARSFMIDDDTLYVVCKKKAQDRNLTLVALALKGLGVKWESVLAVDLPSAGIGPAAGIVTRDHIVQFFNILSDELRWSCAAIVVDKRGQKVQTIFSQQNSLRPLAGDIANDRIVIITDNVIECYGGE